MPTFATPACSIPNFKMLSLASILPLRVDRKNRTTVDYLRHEAALAADISINGVRNPIKVYATAEERFQLLCGQTRLNAARRANLVEIPAIVIGGQLTVTRLLTEELADNNFGKSFDFIAQAEIYHEIMQENGWTPAELCKHVPIVNPSTLSKLTGMRERLVPELKELLIREKKPFRMAYALQHPPAEMQMAAYEQVKDMSVDHAEQHIARLCGSKPKKKFAVKAKYRGMEFVIRTESPEELLKWLEEVRNTVASMVKSKQPIAALPNLLNK